MLFNFLKMFFGDWVNILFTVGIIVGAFVLGSKCYNCRVKLTEHAGKIKKVTSIGKANTAVDEAGNLRTYANNTVTTTDDFRQMHKEFDEICAECDLIPQYIAIFPSVGILGTVFGLMIQASAHGLDEMTGSIGVALSSTFLALLVTIIFKIVVTLKISKPINDCEVEYANYERFRRDNTPKDII